MAPEEKKFKPETLMMSYGYKPELSEGAIKCPIFQTSTFVFKTAEEGKAFFEVAYGHREKKPTEELGLIYSRLNNPDLEILENRLTLWDEAEDAAVFESGLAAITTVLFEFLKPGDFLLHSAPVYGGTDHFIKHVLSAYGIKSIQFTAMDTKDIIEERIRVNGAEGKLALIFVETPANPTNALIDIAMCREIADQYSSEEKKVYIAVDNTYMGPLWQHPLKLGANLVLYSATKYLGGHSDLIAGACLGSSDLITRIRTLRTFLGNMAGPWTGWLLMRSLETLKPRMEIQAKNAVKVAKFLCDHSKVKKIYYLGALKEHDPQFRIYKHQCSSPGAMLSFDVCGGEKEAFQFLNNLKIIKLAVSLGGTESLAEHPATMTHVDMSEEDRLAMSITGKLIRISVGIENVDDIIWDINQALDCIC
jgi:methionine-gamma-lyase